jgi:hypothetical protein
LGLRDEVTGKLGRLHIKELYDQCSSPNIIQVIKSRRMRSAWHVAWMKDRRRAYRVLVARLDGTRPLQRPRNRWEYNNKMDLQEVGWERMNSIVLAPNREK